MPKLRSLLPLLALALSTAVGHAQLTPLQDPANLAGERVSPQDPADTLPLNHGAPALQQLLAKLRTCGRGAGPMLTRTTAPPPAINKRFIQT